MPSSARPAISGVSNIPQSLKRAMSDVDAESAPQDPKKVRRDSSAEPSTRRDSNRDTKRRRKRKKKAPVVNTATKNEATRSGPDERSRAPLSTRNEIIRFSSAPCEADVTASNPPVTDQALSSKSPSKIRQDSSQTLDDITEPWSQGTPSTPNGNQRRSLPGPASSSLEEKVAQLETELNSKNRLITSYQALLNQVQQAVTCQVCLDLMYKPYALAPCGHLACYNCLVNWFTAPPPDNRPAPPAISRRKTCPHCRAVVRERPVEVWGVKGIAQAAGKSGLLPNQLPVPVEDTESSSTNVDPWKDIFPKPGAAHRRRFPWFVHDADIDADNIDVADIAPRGEDVGMLDREDGGIYRCLDCMHEIWDGVCSSCGRVYPGHRPEGDEDDEGDPVGWLEDQMGAEEVDVADDPGWMGLEGGEADDGGDFEDWLPYEPWRRRLRMFGGPWGFLGTIHVDEEDEGEDDEMYGRIDDLRAVEEDEGSEEEGYESSFIDDRDEVGIADLEDGPRIGPRIYEIGGDDDDKDYRPSQRSRIVDSDSDEGDEQGSFSDVPEHGRAGRRRLVASDEEPEEEEIVHSRPRGGQRRAPRFVESDSESVAYCSDG